MARPTRIARNEPPLCSQPGRTKLRRVDERGQPGVEVQFTFKACDFLVGIRSEAGAVAIQGMTIPCKERYHALAWNRHDFPAAPSVRFGRMSDRPDHATVVLVHGAWHGAWCWGAVVPLLDAAGVPSIAVDLPGHGASTERLGDLYSHADHLRGLLGSIDGAIILVGHSYGGAVISEAASGLSEVRSLVYLCAIVPDIGETVTTVAMEQVPPDDRAGDVGELIQVHPDGTTTVDVSAAAPLFYADCAPSAVSDSLKRLGPQNSVSFVQPLRHAAWREIPSTYVVCTEDRVIAVPYQRALAKRAGSTVVEWPTSHSPFLSRPDLVAALLASLAGAG